MTSHIKAHLLFREKYSSYSSLLPSITCGHIVITSPVSGSCNLHAESRLSPTSNKQHTHTDVSHPSSSCLILSKCSIILDEASELGQIHTVRHVLGCDLALLNCPFGSNKVFFLHPVASNFITLCSLNVQSFLQRLPT